MKIAADTVVLLEYAVRDEGGSLLDTSGDQPMAYLHGHDQIVPGLEKALEGLSAGENVETTIAPAEAYGERDEKKMMTGGRTAIPEDVPVEIGAVLGATGPDGQTIPLWVVGVEADQVTLDGNHPLAGKHLSFTATVKEVRTATPEELAHGHAHGPGGAH